MAGHVRGFRRVPPDLADGQHQVVAHAADLAGNRAEASLTFELIVDLAPPSLAITAPEDGELVAATSVAVRGTASDDRELSGVLLDGIEVEVVGGEFAHTFSPLEDGPVVLLAVARDAVGKSTEREVSFTVDTTPPELVLEAPASLTKVTQSPELQIRGRVGDANGIAALSVNQLPVEVVDGFFELGLTLEEGTQTIEVVATDTAGNTAVERREVTLVSVPTLTIDSPGPLALIASENVRVSGTVSDPEATVLVNGAAAEVSGNGYFLEGLPVAAGRNLINVQATTPDGRLATASVTVLRDNSPPRVTILHPAAGATVDTAALSVAGTVRDSMIAVGEMELLTVSVNGQPATVADGSFLVEGLVLPPGQQVLRAVAVDASGNVGESTIAVDVEPPAGARIDAVSGSLQSATVGASLAEPLVARVTDDAGEPVAGEVVVFRTHGNGILNDEARSIAVVTDAGGLAAATFTLGTRAGFQRVEATAVGYRGPAVFVVRGVPGAAAHVFVDTGNQQSGTAGARLAEPFVAVVTDAAFNRLAGVPVRFQVVQGEGAFGAGEREVLRRTNADGRAAALLTLGPEEGAASDVVEAVLEEVPATDVATFVASARQIGIGAETSISGLVLDNADQPIPGVSIRLGERTVRTDETGLFTLAPAPAGTVDFVVDGATAERPGIWPHLEFTLTSVPGRVSATGDARSVSRSSGTSTTARRRPGPR